MMMSPQSSSEDFAGGTSDSVAKHFSMIAKTTWEGINLAVLMMFDVIIKSHANVDKSTFARDPKPYPRSITTLHSSTIPLRPLENGIMFPQGRVNRISPSIWFPLGGRNVRQEVQESDKGTKVGAISE